MVVHVAPRAFGLVLGFCAFASVAAAQPAQIVYAAQSGSQSPPAQVTSAAQDGLAGGGETSYGYGAAQTRRPGRTPAVIDIRRANSGGRVEPISYQPEAAIDDTNDAAADETRSSAPQTQAQNVEQGAQPWLERERVGPPYQAGGQWYVPTPEPGYEQTGRASWYGPTFNGQRTASGEVFDQTALTAAHPTLPIPSLVQVTNLENGREVIVRVNDRGPFVGGRLIDVSQGAAQVLGIERNGTARVHVRYLGPAPRHVNADGSMAAATPPVPALAGAQNPVEQEGPASLLPPSTQDASAAVQETQPPAYVQAAPAIAANDGYFVQVGAFSELENAHRVRTAVLAAGPVVVDTRQTANGELFRVRVGPYPSRAEAEGARQTLAQLGYGGALIAAR